MPRIRCLIRGCHESRKWLRSLDGVRAESVFCTRHACRTLVGFPNAIPCARVAIPGTRHCEIHPSCAFDDCDSQRSTGSQFCHAHSCHIPGCLNVASSSSHRCEIHMPCPVTGCPGFLFQRPDGRGWYGACRGHVNKPCDFADCPRRVGLSNTYCAEHICTVKGCIERKSSRGSNCQHHTCAVNGCPLPVNHPDQVRPNHHTCAYCLIHECRIPDCHVIATVPEGHCSMHGCRIRGCNNAKSPDESLDGYCFTHISADMFMRAEKAGRIAEFQEAIERKEREMDRLRKLERIQKEKEDRLRLEEKIESLELENLRLQVENASVADHYTAEQPSHRYSPESPRGSFSYHRRMDDHVHDVLRSRGYDDDDDSVISGSTDYIPVPPRRLSSVRHVRLRT